MKIAYVTAYYIFALFIFQLDTDFVEAVVDPCNKPENCVEYTNVADPNDCHMYYWCINNQWDHMLCGAGWVFDSVSLVCALQGTCQQPCPTVTGSTPSTTTLAPGLCAADNVTNCIDGQKYADKSDCESYFVCNHTIGKFVHEACPPSRPVFDIFQLDCVDVYEGFVCEYRCVTPAPNTTNVTEEPLTTTTTTEQLSDATLTVGDITTSHPHTTTESVTMLSVSATTIKPASTSSMQASASLTTTTIIRTMMMTTAVKEDATLTSLLPTSQSQSTASAHNSAVSDDSTVALTSFTSTRPRPTADFYTSEMSEKTTTTMTTTTTTKLESQSTLTSPQRSLTTAAAATTTTTTTTTGETFESVSASAAETRNSMTSIFSSTSLISISSVTASTAAVESSSTSVASSTNDRSIAATSTSTPLVSIDNSISTATTAAAAADLSSASSDVTVTTDGSTDADNDTLLIALLVTLSVTVVASVAAIALIIHIVRQHQLEASLLIKKNYEYFDSGLENNSSTSITSDNNQLCTSYNGQQSPAPAAAATTTTTTRLSTGELVHIPPPDYHECPLETIRIPPEPPIAYNQQQHFPVPLTNSQSFPPGYHDIQQLAVAYH